MQFIQKLREEFSKLQGEANAALEAHADKAMPDDVKAEQEKRFARMEQIAKIVEESNKFAKLALENGTATTGKENPGKVEYDAQAGNKIADASKIDRAEFARAVNAWASSGSMAGKFSTITTASQSGIFLPVEVSQPLVPVAINTFRAALDLYGLKPMTTVQTNAINIPVLSASSGSKLSETASTETENEPGLSESIVSKPAPYQSGSSWFSNTQLQANDFDLRGATVPAMVASKEPAVESDIVSGIIADAGITQVVTTAGTNAITVADLVALDNALPKRFQFQKVIILSQSAYAAAEGLTFASGPFALTTDANGVKRFQGTPVLRSDNFQSLATGHTIGVVMSLAGFHLRDAGQQGIERYVNQPTRPSQTGMNLIGHHAYGYAPSAVAKFKTA
jgi:HK97 family phage major capsid protein